MILLLSRNASDEVQSLLAFLKNIKFTFNLHPPLKDWMNAFDYRSVFFCFFFSTFCLLRLFGFHFIAHNKLVEQIEISLVCWKRKKKFDSFSLFAFVSRASKNFSFYSFNRLLRLHLKPVLFFVLRLHWFSIVFFSSFVFFFFFVIVKFWHFSECVMISSFLRCKNLPSEINRRALGTVIPKSFSLLVPVRCTWKRWKFAKRNPWVLW